MKKKFAGLWLFLFCLSALFSFSACDNSPENTDNEVSIGIPADELTSAELEYYEKYINDYTEYLKTLACEIIEETFDSAKAYEEWDFLFAVDRIYIYDLSQVTPETLAEDDKLIYDAIRTVLPKCNTILCCSGYVTYYADNYITPIENIGRFTEMFANDQNFVPCSIRAILTSYYIFTLPKETRILDFGNEYAFRYQPTYEEAVSFTPQYKTVTPVAAE